MKRYLLAGCRNVKLLLISYRCYSESAAEPGLACFIRRTVRAGVPSPSLCPSLLIKGVIYNLFTLYLLHITKVWGNSSVTMINLWSFLFAGCLSTQKEIERRGSGHLPYKLVSNQFMVKDQRFIHEADVQTTKKKAAGLSTCPGQVIVNRKWTRW